MGNNTVIQDATHAFSAEAATDSFAYNMVQDTEPSIAEPPHTRTCAGSPVQAVPGMEDAGSSRTRAMNETADCFSMRYYCPASLFRLPVPTALL